MGIDLTQPIVLWPINYCQDPRTLNTILFTITLLYGEEELSCHPPTRILLDRSRRKKAQISIHVYGTFTPYRLVSGILHVGIETEYACQIRTEFQTQHVIAQFYFLTHSAGKERSEGASSVIAPIFLNCLS